MDEHDANSPSAVAPKVFLIINRQITPLEKIVTRLGRQLDNDIVFHEEAVSRFHAEIRYEEGRYVLYDSSSISSITRSNSRPRGGQWM